MEKIDILILTASFGNGHNSATQALIEKLNIMYPELNVVSKDIFDIITPKLKEYFIETYNLMTRSGINIYNTWYAIRDNKVNLIDEVVVKLNIKRFDDYMKKVDPKVLISVYPTSAQFASYYKKIWSNDLKIITVVTDVVTSWEWIAEDTDLYLVPSDDIKNNYIKKGIDSSCICVSGIPVRNEFENDINVFKKKNQVLIMASSMGKLELNAVIIEKLSRLPYKIVIITGRNKTIHNKLLDMWLPENIELVGFTSDVASYMKDSDIIVTKPGGVTIFESISMSLPMIIFESNVGQEMANVEFIKKYKLGGTISTVYSMPDKIKSMMQNENILNKIKKNMISFRRNTNIVDGINKVNELFLKS